MSSASSVSDDEKSNTHKRYNIYTREDQSYIRTKRYNNIKEFNDKNVNVLVIGCNYTLEMAHEYFIQCDGFIDIIACKDNVFAVELRDENSFKAFEQLAQQNKWFISKINFAMYYNVFGDVKVY